MEKLVKPQSNYAKVNVKGLFSKQKFTAAVGCVARDDKGDWLRGAKGIIGLTDPTSCELWAIFHGLKLAHELGLSRMILETESEEALDILNNPVNNYHLFHLVEWIKNLKEETWEHISLVNVTPSANTAAQVLADHAFKVPGSVEVVKDAPSVIKFTLRRETE